MGKPYARFDEGALGYPLVAVVRSRRVRRNVREQLQVNTSALLYPVSVMDSYVDQFQAVGGSMVMLAKGNRSNQVREACGKHGEFYLGSIGGPAARLAEHSIKKVEVLEFLSFVRRG